MGVEIERKFLVTGEAWRAGADAGTPMVQGYLVGHAAVAAGFAKSSVRVRVAGSEARINIKGATLGIRRAEYEYPMPVADAREILQTLCEGTVEKTRYRLPMDGHVFEIDVFAGANAGLVVAEVELGAEGEAFAHPPWLAREVSHLTRYYNVALIAHPYAGWSAAERAGEDVG